MNLYKQLNKANQSEKSGRVVYNQVPSKQKKGALIIRSSSKVYIEIT